MDVLFAGIATRDLALVQPWYERFFGRPPDITVSADEVMWQVTDTSWLYLVLSAHPSDHALITIAVADLRAASDAISERGLASRAVEDIEGAGRKAIYADPAGNTVTLIEVAAD